MNTATILVVDDEPQIRRVMRTTLSSNGYAVVEARSGEEALEVLRKERPGTGAFGRQHAWYGWTRSLPRNPR